MGKVTDLIPFFETAKNRMRVAPEAADAISEREQVLSMASRGVRERIRVEFPQIFQEIFQEKQPQASEIGAQVVQAGEVQYAKATPAQLQELAIMRAHQALEAIQR